MKRILFISLLTLLTITSCIIGRREGVVQKPDASYLHFTTLNEDNLLKSYMLIIDEAQPFKIEIDKTTNRNTRFSDKKLYQLTPGKHGIKVLKDGNLIIDKIVYIGDQETMEIEIK